MSYKTDHTFRIVADIGSWNFRYSKDSQSGSADTVHNFKSRVGKQGKSGQTRLVSDHDSKFGFVDEVETKFQNVFTKSVATNFGLLDSLFDQLLRSYSIVNEKRYS